MFKTGLNQKGDNMKDILVNGIGNGIEGIILFGLTLFFTSTKLSEFIHANSKKAGRFIITGILGGLIFNILAGIPGLISGNNAVVWNSKGTVNTIIFILAYGFCFLTLAVFEEFLMRGYVLKRFLNKFSILKAVLLESLIFSLLHFFSYLRINDLSTNLITDLICAFIFGVFTSIMAIKDGSLARCIGFHFSANLFEYLLYPDTNSKFNTLIYYNVCSNKPFIDKEYVETIILIIVVAVFIIKDNMIIGSKFTDAAKKDLN